jgi:type IV pilus assembly protein PilC
MEFTYTAINALGKKESAMIQAPSAAVAGHLLKQQGLLPTEIQEKASGSAWGFVKNLATVSLDEKINFVQNLGVMLKSGIAVSKAMEILVKQTKNPKFKNILTNVRSQVEEGKNISEALSQYPEVFSDIIINMIKVGEISGNLEKSLGYLSIQLRREADLKSKTRGAMIYPSVIVGAMLVIGVLMSIFVLPQLTSVFKEFNSSLPLVTRMVVFIADFMSGNAILVISGMILLTVSAVVGIKTKQGQRALDYFLLHFFIINAIIKKINLARFSRILSSLLKSGVPIVQSLEVAGDSMGNVFYKELAAQAANDVKLGRSLTVSLGKNPALFPVLVVQMLQVGEESGTVQDILEQLADHYEEEVDTTLRNLSSIIEPLLLLFIGGIVGILAMALITPIYNISQTIQ